MLRTAMTFSALAMMASAATAGSYSAKPTLPASGKLITRDIVWNCGPAACQGSTDESRPAVICQSLAKRAGPIDSFMANGHAFTAAELARCNASAKALPAQALASQ